MEKDLGLIQVSVNKGNYCDKALLHAKRRVMWLRHKEERENAKRRLLIIEGK